jgi:hypothetical protein
MHTFSFQTTTRTWFQGLLLALLLIAPAPTPVLAQDTDTYDQDSIVKEAGAFLGGIPIAPRSNERRSPQLFFATVENCISLAS